MLIFNGKDLSDFGVTAIGRGTYGAPVRDVEKVHVPGRNGDVYFDNGCYMNAEVIFPDCCIEENFSENSEALRNFLFSTPGYCRLEDSYHPDEYRMAAYTGPFAPDVHTARGNSSGTFDLKFDCMPQRWLKDGEHLIEIPIQRADTSVTPYKYYTRAWFSASEGGHRMTIETQTTADITVTYYSAIQQRDVTQTFTGTKYVTIDNFTIGAGYADIVSTKPLTRLSYDTTEVAFRGLTAIYYTILKNPGTMPAQPLWTLTPGAASVILTTGTTADYDAGGSLTIAGNASTAYRIDTANSFCSLPNGSPAGGVCSGKAPVLPDGEAFVGVYGATADTRLRVIPRYWRI